MGREGMLQHYIMKKRFVDVLPDGFSVDLEERVGVVDSWAAGNHWSLMSRPAWRVRCRKRLKPRVWDKLASQHFHTVSSCLELISLLKTVGRPNLAFSSSK